MNLPPYMEMTAKTVPGQGEEDCMYPISPQLLPHGRPYLQPYPLTRTQLYTITKPLQSLPIAHDLVNKLHTDPSKFPFFQHFYFSSIPTRQEFPRLPSTKIFPAEPEYSMTLNNSLLQLHLQNQKLQSEIYRLRKSTLSR